MVRQYFSSKATKKNSDRRRLRLGIKVDKGRFKEIAADVLAKLCGAGRHVQENFTTAHGVTHEKQRNGARNDSLQKRSDVIQHPCCRAGKASLFGLFNRPAPSSLDRQLIGGSTGVGQEGRASTSDRKHRPRYLWRRELGRSRYKHCLAPVSVECSQGQCIGKRAHSDR